MISLAKLLSTWFGIGYMEKGAGTVAALITALLLYISLSRGVSFWVLPAVATLLFFIGVWTSGQVEAIWGHDSNRVVIDEVLGMCVAMVFVPVSWQTAGLALLLFRIFDIAKPLFIRRAEALPSGWGVMADDLLAGVYANLVLHVLLKAFKLN